MTWHTQQLTLTEFWHPPDVAEVNRQENDCSQRGFDRDLSWGGMSKAACLDLPSRGWPEGVARAEALLNAPDVAPTGTGHLAHRWSYDDGEALDVARFYDGMPCWRQPYRTPGGAGGRVKTVVAHASANCHVTATELAWRAYALVRYADALETAGYRVAIMAQYTSRDCYRNGDSWECLVTVKRPEDPLDLSQVAAVLSAAAFRWYSFTWQAMIGKPLRGNRGHDQERQPTEANIVYLPGHVRDRASAERWLTSATAERGRD